MLIAKVYFNIVKAGPIAESEKCKSVSLVQQGEMAKGKGHAVLRGSWKSITD